MTECAAQGRSMAAPGRRVPAERVARRKALTERTDRRRWFRAPSDLLARAKPERRWAYRKSRLKGGAPWLNKRSSSFQTTAIHRFHGRHGDRPRRPHHHRTAGAACRVEPKRLHAGRDRRRCPPVLPDRQTARPTAARRAMPHHVLEFPPATDGHRARHGLPVRRVPVS